VRVAVVGFGSVWRNRFGKCDPRGRPTSPVYYNTTGVLVHGNVRQRPQICGYARFDTIGGFDPNHPSRMIGRVFECAEPAVWMGSNKLLFKRILNAGERTDRFLISVSSALVGQLAVGEQEWRSGDAWLLSFSECAGQQESMLLMSIGQWVRTSLGLFVLEPGGRNDSLARVVLQTGREEI
jgi:hypothetical protein